jgi:hypothetical protein
MFQAVWKGTVLAGGIGRRLRAMAGRWLARGRP